MLRLLTAKQHTVSLLQHEAAHARVRGTDTWWGREKTGGCKNGLGGRSGGKLAVGFEAIDAAFKLHVSFWKNDDADHSPHTHAQ